jgi:bifunctional DNA-binding transcriptional regulator/antitoxin component of YhaV-PrlF toxin-antitoxin module
MKLKRKEKQKMETTTMSERGQISVPAEIRKKYHFQTGQKFAWLDTGSSLKLIPIPDDPIAALRGSGKGEKLLEKLLEERRKERERDA